MVQKPGQNSLSLASLFSLTTAVAMVIWVVMYAPWLLCCLVVVALPAMLRLRDYLETAEHVKQTLTLTEILVGYFGASLLSALSLLSLCFALVGIVIVATRVPDNSEARPIALTLMILGTWPILGFCVGYFLLGEVWSFPKRFAHTFGRLPSYYEQAAQVLKAISQNVFVYGACSVVLFALTKAIPVSNLPADWAASAAALALAATAVAAYLAVRYQFHHGWVRAIAGLGLAGVLAALITPAEPNQFVAAPWIVAAALLIALPCFRWPPTLEARTRVIASSPPPLD